MSHLCHAVSCHKPVPPKLLFCRKHWFMLSVELRREVWATYRYGQEPDKKPSLEYLAVQRRAVAYVAELEGKPAPAPAPPALDLTYCPPPPEKTRDLRGLLREVIAPPPGPRVGPDVSVQVLGADWGSEPSAGVIVAVRLDDKKIISVEEIRVSLGGIEELEGAPDEPEIE